MRRLAWLVALHLAGAAAGYAARRAGVPLAWMLGPIASTALLAGLPGFRAPPLALRWGGQVIVGSAIALQLSPAALRGIAGDVPVMVLAALVSVVFALVLARALAGLGVLDPRTALLSLLPGGAAEMATLAERRGGRPEFVALAQTLRLSLAVLTIPFLLLALEPAAAATALPPSAAVPPAPSALVALALAGPAGALLHRAGMANAFFIGALVGVGALAVTGLVRAPLPGGLVAGGQVLLGVSLGGMLRPQVLVVLGRDLRLVASFSVLLLGLGVALGSVLAALGVAPFGAMILATSAGGVAEMSIAAAAFGHDPAYVSAYHLVRIFIIVPLAEPLLRLVP